MYDLEDESNSLSNGYEWSIFVLFHQMTIIKLRSLGKTILFKPLINSMHGDKSFDLMRKPWWAFGSRTTRFVASSINPNTNFKHLHHSLSTTSFDISTSLQAQCFHMMSLYKCYIFSFSPSIVMIFLRECEENRNMVQPHIYKDIYELCFCCIKNSRQAYGRVG